MICAPQLTDADAGGSLPVRSAGSEQGEWPAPLGLDVGVTLAVGIRSCHGASCSL